MKLRPAFAILLFTALAAVALAAADFTGRWEGLPTLPDGTQFKVVFAFTVASDGKLTGSVETSEYGTFTANDVVVAGDKISFNVPTDGGTYFNTGTLRPDGLLVEGSGPDGPFPPVLYRRPAVDLTGKWLGKVETPDGPAEVVYIFETRDGKLSGIAHSPMGEIPLTNITVEGDHVAFASEVSGLTIKRRGTVTDDTMKLTINIDGNETSATFTRVPTGVSGK